MHITNNKSYINSPLNRLSKSLINKFYLNWSRKRIIEFLNFINPDLIYVNLIYKVDDMLRFILAYHLCF